MKAVVALLWLGEWQEARVHLERGGAHLRRNEPDAAIRELTRAAALDPRSAEAHLLLGQAYLSKGSAQFVAQAKAEFQEALYLDPGLAQASFFAAKIDLDLGRLGSAERELRRALERKPAGQYVRALLGEVRRQQGHPEEAVTLATQAIEIEPAIPYYYYRALAWWDQRNEARALADLERVLRSTYATVEAHQTAGAIHLHHNRLVEAEASFRKAAGLGPDRAEPRLRLAQVLRRQRRHDLALKELAGVEAAPQLSSAYFQKLLAEAAFERGLILEEQGDAAGAKVWFQRALEMDPAHEEAARRLRP